MRKIMNNGTVVDLNPYYTATQIAKAAGVRKSLILKYIREGVRGTGCLVCKEYRNGEPIIFRSNLEKFANQHNGRAGTIALLALENLKERRE